MNTSVLKERKKSVSVGCNGDGRGICCERESVSGAVSQRACVYCGARVVLNPITDAYHIVHGPIGCASYTWDIRGSLTSGAEVYRNSFSTDLREKDIVFGGTEKLTAAIDELMEKFQPSPKLIFVYATCIVGVIGDDVEAVCRQAEEKYKIRVIPVKAPGFSGTKSHGYKLACNAIMELISPSAKSDVNKQGVNILGDYNLAGEMWIIRGYLEKIGIPVVATITGDASHDKLLKAPTAALNIVQCAGSSTYLAERMKDEMGIPYIKVSFFGIEDTTASLLRVADWFDDAAVSEKARRFAEERTAAVLPFIEKYKPRFVGKKAAIFVGGGFKAISLIKQFNELGIKTVVVGTQTGKKEEYEIITALADSDTVILDDANPAELERFMLEKEADILVGGVKERPLAYKLGMAFCDHNHERKHPLAGFEGIENFIAELHKSINNPVWKYIGGENTMGANLVNLNVNPCKMCMPMGAASALCGLKGCMSILHGSQGCATYIRRHMATHYNEPVDIASSSLTEEGTVFGGEKNLLKGLKNLIELYDPEVIGVCTTCLAETIGEDVDAIVRKFREQNPNERVKIINVASPGYGGTQNEGWFAALTAIVKQAEPNSALNGKINIITPMISPADTRWLKDFLTDMGVDFILLPDLSENLDGVTEKPYSRLKKGGADIAEVGGMAGSRVTIEFSEFTTPNNSPGEYIRDKFGVPLIKLPLPVGIRAMDMLTAALKKYGGVVPQAHEKERGRYLDAMVDSHKHCAEVKAAVFGEPDFTAAIVRLCCENGALPVMAATSSVSPELCTVLANELEQCKDFFFTEEIPLLDDSDFAAIERSCHEQRANVLIGSSDGRRIAEKMELPLIRCAFPVHDYVGGQRVRMLGFEGSLNILDQMANAMLQKKESGFRKELYDRFYEFPDKKAASELNRRTASHPCFGEHACQNARIHLPVAPKCNIQCNYCLRNFDCMNESRPGVSSKLLTPAEAFARYKKFKAEMPNLTVAGIAGPGDALANFEETRETLRLIRAADPDITFCIATNGLLLPRYVPELKALGVSHVTVTVNAVDVEVGAKIYRHIDYMGERYSGTEGAAILLANQLTGIKMLSEAGIMCKMNCVTLKGINDAHIPEITKKAAKLGVFMTNIMPHIPVKGTSFEGLERMTNKEINRLREQCGVNIKQMKHCRQCRSDAVGTLGTDMSIEMTDYVPALPKLPVLPKKAYSRRFAVATKSGSIVDTHFGHAEEFLIYESDGSKTRLVETRKVSKYCNGPECDDDKSSKWDNVVNALSDCEGVIALRIGPTPEKRLIENGINPITTYERVETAVALAAEKQVIMNK